MTTFASRVARLTAGLAFLTLGAACGTGHGSEPTLGSETSPLIAGAAASGRVPAPLPARMSVGLFENLGDDWQAKSGVKWDMRYAYFVDGWLHRWGDQQPGEPDGQAALDYMRECDEHAFVPVIQFYLIRNSYAPKGDESKTLEKVQNAAYMKDYFGQLKVMLQMAKTFGKPTVLMLEGDGFGFLEMQSNENPQAPAAVAKSGVPELAGLPNTVAGFGMAFLQMRKALGATNVVIGPDVPAYATGDIMYASVTEDLAPHVDKQYAFLAPLGLAANQTGETFDFLAADPLDADSDYYRLVYNQSNRWWDDADDAPIASRSFNRYAEWLRLFNRKSEKRWMLWQIPIGNSNHLNVWNNGAPREGYKDNRAEYLFGSKRDQHLAKLADAGVFALLFGQGEDGTANYTNDVYTDGELFLRSHVGAVVKAGGFPIARGDGTTPNPPNPGEPTADGGVAPGTDPKGNDAPSDAAASSGCSTAPLSASFSLGALISMLLFLIGLWLRRGSRR